MGKPKIFITRRIPDEFLKELKEKADIAMWDKEYIPVPADKLLTELKEACGVLTMLSDKIDRSVLEQAPHLKIIANLAVCYDNIDVQACREKDIVVCHTPDVLTDTTADLAFGLLMASARRLVEAAEYIKSGQWTEWGPFLLAGKDVHHKTIGIVGMGRIGKAVAKRAFGFDMRILYYNRSRKPEVEAKLGAEYAEFDRLLQESDFVVNLVPLTKDTFHLFDARAFHLMKKDAIFINAGRGDSVDENALYEALVNGEISGAGLDVFSGEPIKSDHPLLGLKQVVALPHIGSSSMETRSKMIQLACANLYSVLVQGGAPLTPVPAK